tara:strand:- start:1483 stop:1620 length:138 start_codon:yes stop_codon:yes gene_type:complete
MIKVKLNKNSKFIMAEEIFTIAGVFWLLIPIGLIGGAVLLKFQGE